MSRVKQAFENGKAFIAFITGGDPDLDTTKKMIIEMQNDGADMIEVGIPFSDPIAEGTVIQEADLRALSKGCTTDKVFEALKDIKDEIHIPLVFVTYMNVVYRYGSQKFIERCVECGIDGIVVPDCPYEEKQELLPYCESSGIDYISYIAPATKDRIKMIAKEAQGFIYCVSSDSVPNMKNNTILELAPIIDVIKEVTDVPCVVGCNDLTPEKNARMCRISDGVIAESDIVKIIGEHGKASMPYISKYIKTIKKSMTE